MAFEKRDLVGIGIEGKSPLQYGAPATLVPDGWKVGQSTNAICYAGGILGDQPGSEIDVTEGSGKEDVGSRSAIEKEPRNFRSLADTPLSGSGIVVLISRVDVRALIEKELRGSHIAGKMKGRTTIAAFGVDQHRIATE